MEGKFEIGRRKDGTFISAIWRRGLRRTLRKSLRTGSVTINCNDPVIVSQTKEDAIDICHGYFNNPTSKWETIEIEPWEE